MTNYLHDIPTGPEPPEEVYVVVEMTKASKNKYEYDAGLDKFMLNRVLYTFAPFDYGFIPRTLDKDGDPLDAILLIGQTTFTGCLVHTRPLGIMEMDDNGRIDDKIITVSMTDPYYHDIKGMNDLPKSQMDELHHFYSTYKIKEGGHVEIKQFRNIEDAYEVINRCMSDYLDSNA